MGTLGGNLCLDTRCNYYDQNYEWRKSIDFCMKKDGEICWVATGSPKCLAVSSTDTAPALLALGATRHAGVGRRRRATSPSPISISNDGIHYLTRRPDEILTAVHIPPMRRLAQRLLEAAPPRLVRLPGAVGRRRREVRRTTASVESARIVLGAVASRPIDADGRGRRARRPAR